MGQHLKKMSGGYFPIINYEYIENIISNQFISAVNLRIAVLANTKYNPVSK